MNIWRPAYWITILRVVSDWLQECDQSLMNADITSPGKATIENF